MGKWDETHDHEGIYAIVNTANNRVYIGRTSKTFYTRWGVHLFCLNRNEHHNAGLQADWNAYGAAAFEFKMVYKALQMYKAMRGFPFKMRPFPDYDSWCRYLEWHAMSHACMPIYNAKVANRMSVPRAANPFVYHSKNIVMPFTKE